MKILFTGASSFTGYWFIRELAAAGHEVTAIFRKRPTSMPMRSGASGLRLAPGSAAPFTAVHSATPRSSPW